MRKKMAEEKEPGKMLPGPKKHRSGKAPSKKRKAPAKKRAY